MTEVSVVAGADDLPSEGINVILREVAGTLNNCGVGVCIAEFPQDFFDFTCSDGTALEMDGLDEGICDVADAINALQFRLGGRNLLIDFCRDGDGRTENPIEKFLFDFFHLKEASIHGLFEKFQIHFYRRSEVFCRVVGVVPSTEIKVAGSKIAARVFLKKYERNLNLKFSYLTS